jgi:23S rRNA (guanosine2251-2'-O)-methyltransferase
MDETLIAVNSNVKRTDADPVILEILDLVRERDITLIPSDKMRISFISKAGKQDGGIVADLFAPPGSKMSSVTDFVNAQKSKSTSNSTETPAGYTILAVDQITTPSNMGMIIRSAVASGSFDAFLVAPGSASVTNPLVIKASGSTALLPAQNTLSDAPAKKSRSSKNLVFITAKSALFQALTELKEDGAEIVLLAAQPQGLNSKSSSGRSNSLYRHDSKKVSLWDLRLPPKCVFVIGGESAGHDPAVEQVATIRAHIPMAPGVESLNCAVTASLVAFAPQLRQSL